MPLLATRELWHHPKKIKTSSIPHWGVRNPCRDVRGSHFSTLMTADSVEDRPSCRQARERARSRSLGAQTYSVPSGKRPNQPAAEIRASLRSRHSRALFHSRMEVGSWPALAIRFRKKPRITPSTGLDVCTMVVRIPKFSEEVRIIIGVDFIVCRSRYSVYAERREATSSRATSAHTRVQT